MPSLKPDLSIRNKVPLLASSVNDFTLNNGLS